MHQLNGGCIIKTEDEVEDKWAETKLQNIRIFFGAETIELHLHYINAQF